MRKLLNIASGLLLESDAEHRDALEKTGFWGKQGAGCLFLSKDTGRFCLAHRSSSVEQPNTWGTWGGAIDSDEDPTDAVRREVREEAGYHGEFDLVPLYVFSHPSGFKYYNFLAVVDTEFTPIMDWETQGFKWVDQGNWPSPLHPGLQALLSDGKSSSIMHSLSSKHELAENDAPMRLKDLCTIKTNFPDADFWIQRRGTKENVGKPTKDFNPENIGIKVVATDVLDPNYLYYLFMHLHSSRKWEAIATGTLNLVNIKTSDVANIPVGSR